MRNVQFLFPKSNQRLVPKQQLVFITFSMIFIILVGCISTQRQDLISTFFLVVSLPATFYLAIRPIKRINSKEISNVIDPRVWMPLSYVIYFVALPMISILLDPKYSMFNDEIPQIMLSTLLGILSLQLGLHMIKPLAEPTRNKIWLDRYAAMFLLLVALTAHLYWWYWRIQNGFFFTHAAGYIPIPNIEYGVRDVLGRSASYIPLYILAVAYRDELWKKRRMVYLFGMYACSIGILFLLAGQIRDFFWFFLMVLASFGYALQIKKIRWGRTSVMIIIVVVGSIFLIYSMRTLSNEIFRSGRQLNYILSNLPAFVKSGGEIVKRSREMKHSPIQRMFLTQDFFDQTVCALNEHSSYGFGSYTIRTFPLIVPRLLWPEKGTILDTEQIIQQNVLHTYHSDGSLTPLTQFYAEGNLIGILIGFFLLGLILSWAHKLCFSLKNGIGGLVLWVVILSSIIQWEHNIPVNLLLGIRNGLLFAVLAFIVSIFSRIKIII